MPRGRLRLGYRHERTDVMAATAPEVDLDEVQELLDAAIAVNEGEGSCLIAERRDGQVQGYQDPAGVRFRSRLHSQPF